MDFKTADQLNTLADAREAYTMLLSIHEATVTERAKIAASLEKAEAQTEALRADLVAANEMLDEAAVEKESLSNSVDDVNTKLALAQSSLEEKSSELAQAVEKTTQLQARIGQLESEAKSAEAKAAQICASVGVEPAQVTPGGEAKQQSLVEQLREIKNPAEQMVFFRKHREEIIKEQ